MHKTLVLTIIVCALGVSCVIAAGGDNTGAAKDMQDEMEDFIQYFRSSQNKSQIQDDQKLSPEDLLKNDLLLVPSTNTGSGSKGAGAKGAVTKPAEVKKDSRDARSVQTGVASGGRKLLVGEPLYKGTDTTTNQYKEGDTGSVHVLTPTVYHAQTYNAQGQSH